MADGKIYITISDKPIGDGGGTEPEKKKKQYTTIGRYIEHEIFHFLKEQAENAINYSINNIGNFTGDYNSQKEMQLVVNMANKVKGLAFAGYYGAKAGAAAVGTAAGGVAGGIIGVAIAVGGMAINFGLNEAANQKQFKRQNFNIDQLRSISGQNILLDGSRGTLE